MSLIKPSRNLPNGALVRTLGDVAPAEPSYYPTVPYVNAAAPDGTGGEDRLSLAHYGRILLRRRGTLFCFALFGGLAAFLFSRAQPPVYRARALIEIQSINEDFLNTRSVNPTSQPLETSEYVVQTQSMVLQSRPVFERAINKLDIETRLISSAPASWISRLRGARPAAEEVGVSPREQALSMIAAGLKVRVQPNTRVLEVTFNTVDPELGADVVNSIAEGFAEQNREARRQSSKSTSKWLGEQLADVKAKLETDEDALQRYASDSDLTFLSDKDNVAGERLRQVQLDLLKAQSDRVMKQSENELAAASTAESLPQVRDDSTLKDYQLQLTTLRRQLAELASTFSPENPKVVNIQAQIATVEAALRGRRAEILSGIQNEYESASRRESLLESAYSSQVALLSKQSTKVAHFSVLQREVDTTRQLYDSMLQRVKEAGLASAMQASESQVIESAIPPKIPFKPDLILNTSFGLFSGICLGVAFIIQRTRPARGFQAPGEIAIQLNVPEFGMIPSNMELSTIRRLLGRLSSPASAAGDPARLELTRQQSSAERDLLQTIAEIRLTLNSPSDLPDRSSLDAHPAPATPGLRNWQNWRSAIAKSFRLALTSIVPLKKTLSLPGGSIFKTRPAADVSRLELTTWQQWHSEIAESFRLTLTSLLLSSGRNGERPHAIVVSSALPGEGKTTVISNLAIALARVNWRVLLIDGDMRKPRLHEVFDVSNGTGFSDFLAGVSNTPIQPTKIPNLFLLPSGRAMDERLFFTAPLRELLRPLKAEFDMILIDTPPLLRMADTRLLSHHADGVILVITQATSRDAVLHATQQLTEDGSRLLGTILNNWEPKTDSPGYQEYGGYQRRYQR
jgi:capsular exopolysaccharide synthesis family protein